MVARDVEWVPSMSTRALGWLGVVVGSLVVAGALVSQGVVALHSASAAPRPTLLAAAPAPTAAPPRTADRLLRHNPFDSQKPDLLAQPAHPGSAVVDGDLPRCEGLEVHAILAGQDPDWSYASFSSKAEGTVLRRPGGRVGGRVVSAITPDRALLHDGDALCRVDLHERREAAGPAVAKPAVAAKPALAGVERLSDGEYRVDRATVERMLENPAELMGTAVVVPEKENGRVAGLRVARLKPGSPLAAIGLREGDRLDTLNGFALGDPESAMSAYARLRGASRLSMTVVRGGKPMQIDYEVR